MHNPTEHVQEHVTHEAAHGGHDEHGKHGRWIAAAALTAAFLAAFAAVTGALATKHLTESTLKRIEANDKWNQYGQKSVKNSNIDTRFFEYDVAKYMASLSGGPTTLPASVEKVHQGDIIKRNDYTNKDVPESMPKIQDAAGSLEVISGKHLRTHETFEFAATMFHISIAIVAIAVVAKQKLFWYLSMVLGLVGLYFFGTALMYAPAAEHEGAEAAATAAEHPGTATHSGGEAAHGVTPAGESPAPAH